jgi:hypothetical protein
MCDPDTLDSTIHSESTGQIHSCLSVLDTHSRILNGTVGSKEQGTMAPTPMGCPGMLVVVTTHLPGDRFLVASSVDQLECGRESGDSGR